MHAKKYHILLTDSAAKRQMTSHPIYCTTRSASCLTDRPKRSRNMENSREGFGKEVDGLWQLGCIGQKQGRFCGRGDESSASHSEGEIFISLSYLLTCKNGALECMARER